jgi:hypothetical protein
MRSIVDHPDLLQLVLRNFTKEDATALVCTCKLVGHISGAEDFSWRLHTDPEEVLKRVRALYDFGPDDCTWHEGCGWRRCLELFSRAMHQAAAHGVLRYTAAEPSTPWCVFGWSGFEVQPQREREWRQRMLDLVSNDPAFSRDGLTRYRYDAKNPTWCVYMMLQDLGFRQALPRAMPRDRDLKHDQIWWRTWRFRHDHTHMTFFKEVKAIKAEIRRSRRLESAAASSERTPV